jgi:lipoate-protein ligase B
MPASPPQHAWICGLGTVPYEPTADLQRDLRERREQGLIPDTLLVLEHDPVITTGHRTEPSEVAYALTTDVPVVPTERGGKATYHGPGQIVAYPIFDLHNHGADVKRFVCLLEQAIIDTLGNWNIVAERNSGYPGVWTGGKKIASIGLRVTKWISFHGIALNVDCDLQPFGWFTPCGIPDVQMTSMATELEVCPTLGEVRRELERRIAQQFGLAWEEVTVNELAEVGVPA